MLLLFCFHFWPSVLHVALYKSFSSIFDSGPLNPKIYCPKFGTKSPISRLVWQTDRKCLGLLGVFWVWPIQWNHAKCCGADPCCHGNEIFGKFGLFFTNTPISPLVCQTDRICFGLPGETTRGPIFVAMATTFSLGAESPSPTGLYVCLSVCMSRCSFKSLLLFCFSMESSHFLHVSSPCGTLQNPFFDV